MMLISEEWAMLIATLKRKKTEAPISLLTIKSPDVLASVRGDQRRMPARRTGNSKRDVAVTNAPILVQTNPCTNGASLKMTFSTVNVTAKRNAASTIKRKLSCGKNVFSISLRRYETRRPPQIKNATAANCFASGDTPKKRKDNKSTNTGLNPPSAVATRVGSPALTAAENVPSAK